MNPPPLSSKRTLKRIAPLTAGKLLALFYGAMGLLFVPFFLMMSAFSSQMPTAQRGVFAAMGVGFALFMPVLYAAFGFIGGVIGAALYNLAAKLVGGIEVEVE